MTTLTSTPNRAVPSGTASRSWLSGMSWLVWRQHRAAFLTMLAITAAALVWIGYQRTQMTDYLSHYGWPHAMSDDWMTGFQPHASWLDRTGGALGVVPVLLGVFIGAPLFAQDLEHGTAKLVASQSAGRTRWLATKLGMTALVLVICTVPLSIGFAWWSGPVRKENTVVDWTSGTVFDVTGPVPVALTLFTVAGGMAIGVLLRRTLMSMVVTFGFAVAVQVVWAYVRLALGDTVTVRTRQGVGDGTFPVLPDGAYQVDQWYVTGSGRLLGWSTCSGEETGKATDACLRKADVVGWSVDYLPISQMPAMQWLGAAILLVLTAAITAFVFFRGRKPLV